VGEFDDPEVVTAAERGGGLAGSGDIVTTLEADDIQRRVREAAGNECAIDPTRKGDSVTGGVIGVIAGGGVVVAGGGVSGVGGGVGVAGGGIATTERAGEGVGDGRQRVLGGGSRRLRECTAASAFSGAAAGGSGSVSTCSSPAAVRTPPGGTTTGSSRSVGENAHASSAVGSAASASL